MRKSSRFPGRATAAYWFLAGVLSLLWLIVRSGTKPSRITYPCQRAAMSTVAVTFGVPLAVPLVAPLARLLAFRDRLSGGVSEPESPLARVRARLATACVLVTLGLLAGLGVLGYTGHVERWAVNPHAPRLPRALTAALSGQLVSAGVPVFASSMSSSLAESAVGSLGPVVPAAVLAALEDYRTTVYHVSGCPEDPVGDRFVGLDNLIARMGQGGLKFYKSATQSLVAGPDGIIASDDVVIVKFNYQWPERGGTNMDLLRGLVRRILDHPDSFTGEVVVCENAQFNSTYEFDRALNNAEDHSLSPRDVVSAFQQAGANVSLYDWTLLRYTAVAEYSDGDTLDGYIVLPYDAQVTGAPSYPKFKTAAGTRISLKHGIWDPGSSTYSREHLKYINVPVLKSHNATYGATACVKHYMGTVTRELSTNSHAAIWYGILGAVIGEIGPADLNILDAVWVNADPYSGPETSYEGATRRNELVAGVDPVAVDVWAVKHILNNAFLANGYMPPWPLPDADADDPDSHFRKYLDNSMQQILAAGYVVTNDHTKIDAVNGNGAAGDFDYDGDVDAADLTAFTDCFTGPGGGPLGSYCYAGDFDGDSDVDCADWANFRFVWTGPGDPPDLPGCANVGVDDPRAEPAPAVTSLSQVYPNPVNGDVTIRYRVGSPGVVLLRVVDPAGRVVRTLFNGGREAGEHSVVWDRKSDSGAVVSSGVYFCQLKAGGFGTVKKLVVAR
ncbi:MAG: DUF362 domain-containing protein [Candidatus Eisenbacteria bacterium]|nr:DUF362 domain-containing protein [Candidatus Eisenbacteria bacterium]